MKYESIPVVINAIQFTGNVDEIIKFTNVNNIEISCTEGRWSCLINTPLARLVVLENDYIIKSDIDELSVVKQDIFEKTYKPIKE